MIFVLNFISILSTVLFTLVSECVDELVENARPSMFAPGHRLPSVYTHVLRNNAAKLCISAIQALKKIHNLPQNKKNSTLPPLERYYVLTGLYALMLHCAKHSTHDHVRKPSLCSYYTRFPALSFSCPSCKSCNAALPCRPSPNSHNSLLRPAASWCPERYCDCRENNSGESYAYENSIQDESDLALRDY